MSKRDVFRLVRGLGPRWRRLVGPSLAFACATLSTIPAAADTSTAADELFREGRRLLEAGHVADACPKLSESMKADPALGTLLFLASCHEKLGLTATAFSEFSSAAEWAERSNRSDRLLFAQKHKAAIEPKLATLLIHAAITAGIEIRLDDGQFSSTLIGSPIPLDPGAHEIEARAPGHESWRTSLTVPPDRATLTVTVPPLVPESAPVSEPEPEEQRTETESDSTHNSQPNAPNPTDSNALLWGAAGLAGAGVIVGSVFGVMTFSARDGARSACPNDQCVPGGLDDINRARTYANVSTVAFGASLVGAAATAYLLIVGGQHAGRAPAAVARLPIVIPTVSSQQAGLSLVGRFE